MSALTFSQESFDGKLPSSLKRRVSRPDLRTLKLQCLTIDEEESKSLMDSINKQINRSRKCLVLTGAGISCNAGIPDFRSSDGLYEMVKKSYPKLSIRSGQEMFDISLFREEEKISIFATFMEKLYSSTRVAQPTQTHRFIAHLKNRGKLLRCYTQNIDGIEKQLGLEMSSGGLEETCFSNHWSGLDVVQLHGDLNMLSCTRCSKTFAWSRHLSRHLRNGVLPNCPKCHEFHTQRSLQGKRNTGTVGLLRPNIVLYGENHPSCDFITHGLNLDLCKGKPDVFFVMGTSLKVDGVKRLVRSISKQVHERNGLVILINKTRIADSSWHSIIDYQIISDCDDWVAYLKSEIPEFFRSQEEVNRIRQLKRENSEARKRQREEKRMTPPPTPQKGTNCKHNIEEPPKLSRTSKKTKTASSRSLYSELSKGETKIIPKLSEEYLPFISNSNTSGSQETYSDWTANGKMEYSQSLSRQDTVDCLTDTTIEDVVTDVDDLEAINLHAKLSKTTYPKN